MLQCEVFIRKSARCVDRLAAPPVPKSDVTTAAHETFRHTVEDRVHEVQLLAVLAHAALTRAEHAEVLGGAGHDVAEELENDAALSLARNAHVHEDGGVLRHAGCVCVGRSRTKLELTGKVSAGASFSSALRLAAVSVCGLPKDQTAFDMTIEPDHAGPKLMTVQDRATLGTEG